MEDRPEKTTKFLGHFVPKKESNFLYQKNNLIFCSKKIIRGVNNQGVNNPGVKLPGGE